MTEKKVLLKDASEQQLREFAQNNLGIEIGANEKSASILTKIQAAYTKEEITVNEPDGLKGSETTGKASKAPAAKKSQGKVERARTAEKNEDMVRVMIARTDGPGGAEDVPLGCNGKIMLVPRGRIVDIPRRYFESLKNAVRHVHDTLEDGSMNPVPREVPDFPYQVYDSEAAAA